MKEEKKFLVVMYVLVLAARQIQLQLEKKLVVAGFITAYSLVPAFNGCSSQVGRLARLHPANPRFPVFVLLTAMAGNFTSINFSFSCWMTDLQKGLSNVNYLPD